MSQQSITKYRRAALNALGVCLLLQLMAGVLGLQFESRSADWYLRMKDLVLIVILLVGSTVYGLIAYVRFLDWKRGSAMLNRSV